MTQTESNDDSGEIDKLLAELENESLPEGSDVSKEKKEEIPIKKLEKPGWADKTNDEINTYDYVEKALEDDTEW